jgi:salicylate hydroxylase
LHSSIGGLAAATSLRQAGHKVTIYERADFAGEVGASISCAANGTRWLEEWGVNVALGRPVILEKLISHDWKTGDIQNVYDLGDYKERWGYVRGDWSLSPLRTDYSDFGVRSTTCSTGSICMKC